MRLFLTVFLFSLSAFAGKPLLVLTSFEPFDITKGVTSETSNSSTIIAEKFLQKSFNSEYFQNIRIEHIVLPVSYTRTIPVLQNFISNLGQEPTWIISLGQTGRNKISLETMASNYQTPDQYDNDNFRPNKQSWKNIKKNFNVVTFNSNVPEFYCSMEKKFQSLFAISTNPGSFICNYLSYEMASMVKEKSIKSIFQFIHIPQLPLNSQSEIQKFSESVDAIVNYIQVFTSGALDQNFQIPTTAKKLKSAAKYYSKMKNPTEKDLCLKKTYSIMSEEFPMINL